MCLYATSQKSAGDPAPKRTIAYKVVEKRTRYPIYFRSSGHPRYTDGSKHSVLRRDVMISHRASRQVLLLWGEVGAYRVGFHVFTSLQTARNQLLRGRMIIKVEVSPSQWVADGNGGPHRPNEAVYTGLKVIGRVK